MGKSGIELIAEERQRQVDVEGWSIEHDDQHTDGELAEAASCYASYAQSIQVPINELYIYSSVDLAHVNLATEVLHKANAKVLVGKDYRWPWDKSWWKPTPDRRIRELQKAGALIAAEIDRLNRLNIDK